MKTLFTAALFFALPALATTLIALDLPALSKSSSLIVQGKVSKTEAKLSKDGMRITTYIYVDVTETLKGEGRATVELTQPGGIVGDIGQRVSGTANLKAGDEIVAFLEPQGPRFMLTGMAQGCYRVQRSSDGKSAFAVKDPDGDVMLLDPVTHAQVTKTYAPLKLDDFKAQIRAALAPPVANEPLPADPRAPQKAVK